MEEIVEFLQRVVEDYYNGGGSGARRSKDWAEGYYFALTRLAELPGVRTILPSELAQNLEQIIGEVETEAMEADEESPQGNSKLDNISF